MVDRSQQEQSFVLALLVLIKEHDHRRGKSLVFPTKDQRTGDKNGVRRRDKLKTATLTSIPIDTQYAESHRLYPRAYHLP